MFELRLPRQGAAFVDQGKTGGFRIRCSAQNAAIAEEIDNKFANSATPLQSITEKAGV
ncbi:MAG: hypothetical protein U1E93_05410 [Alphaproteobacteria bacterium]